MRIEQVVTNLVNNAIKYGSGKPVQVSLEAVGPQARLTVEDQGIGISPEYLPRIFGRFRAGGDARSTRQGTAPALWHSPVQTP